MGKLYTAGPITALPNSTLDNISWPKVIESNKKLSLKVGGGGLPMLNKVLCVTVPNIFCRKHYKQQNITHTQIFTIFDNSEIRA